MSKKISAVLIAGLFTGLSISATAQSQPPSSPAQPQAAQSQPATPQTQPGAPAASPAADTIKVTGCLKNEKDVAGLKPNVAERAGITEDYILTDVKLAADSKTSAIGLASMYEVEGVSESELKSHLNQQVEVTGRLSRAETGASAVNAANRGDVPDFTATSIRMLAATCPAAQ
jgi:hypothetical protein